MSLCDKDLRKHLESTTMSDYDVYQLADQMGNASEFLHNNNIIHRDIKPANIFLREFEHSLVYKLGDFGSVSK